tara:strand:+ start:347 stop:967 length:621 start_codon:yes stop_codon:yes gene_type:complete
VVDVEFSQSMKNLFKILVFSILMFSCDKDNPVESSLCDESIEVELWGECYNIETTTILDLSYSNLIGDLPSSIGNLENLTWLVLYGNQLTGSIPTEIGNLTSLFKLNLGNNQLTGSIPIEIGNLTSLFELSLVSNQLTGQIPTEIGNLSSLSKLFLQNNNLSGNIPIEICELNIIQIGINNNQLCPSYPSCISQVDIDPQDTTECP